MTATRRSPARAPKRPPASPPVAKLFVRWIETAAMAQKSRTRKRHAFRVHLAKLVGTARVEDLTKERMAQLRDSLVAQGHSAKAARYIVADCLNQMLRDCARDGRIRRNPAPVKPWRQLSDQTVGQYAQAWARSVRAALRTWITPEIGARPLAELSLEDEARIRLRMQDRREPPAAIRAVLSGVLTPMWEAASNEGLARPPRAQVEPEPEIDDGDSRRTMTVGQFADLWLSTTSAPPYVPVYLTRHRRRALERYVLPKIGHIRIDRVNQRRATELQLEMFRRGLSVATVRHVVSSICGGMFRDAKTQGLTKQTPFLGLRWPRGQKPRPDPFTDAELAAIRRFFKRYARGRWNVWIALLVETGARPSEIAGLQWGDLDLEAGTAEIRRALVAREITPGKTLKSQRTLMLPADLVELLRRARPRNAKDTDWICLGTDGRAVDSTNWAASKWHPALKRIGLRRRRLYVLRHSYISRALSLGAPPLAVASYCGTSLAKLSDTYAAWINVDKQDPLSAARQRVESVPAEVAPAAPIVPPGGPLRLVARAGRGSARGARS